jgi:small-conductance mechanosensitive channel
MDKISNEKVAQVLADVPGTLRKLAEENKELHAKVAHYELRNRVEKLASEMHRKNLHTDVEASALADYLEKQASEGKLDAIEEATKMVAPDMGHKLAQLTTDERGTSASSDLERFIVGGVG